MSLDFSLRQSSVRSEIPTSCKIFQSLTKTPPLQLDLYVKIKLKVKYGSVFVTLYLIFTYSFSHVLIGERFTSKSLRFIKECMKLRVLIGD